MKKNNKNYRIKTDKPIVIKRRRTSIKTLYYFLTFLILLFVLITIRLFYLQFIKKRNGETLKESAYRQQTSSKVISPERGSIYDRTGRTLAISEDVDTVSINPSLISNEKKKIVAAKLSEIFELDYDDVLKKVNSTSSVETIAKKIENEKIVKLETWMKETKITSGINIDEDNKRYYPYNELASQVIGFCGVDNQGLEGIEASFDNILSGRSGKIITTTDINSSEISDVPSSYVAVENGSDLYLTIDANVQTVVEKYLKKSVDNNECEYATAIIMEPSTGNLLSMATYPTYNLNTPFSPNTSEYEKKWDTLSSSEKNTYLNQMWRNKNISDLYEPGSTFKTIVASIALEENITESNISHNFYCCGYEEISGTKIRCWSSNAHGYQTLKQSLANSCNPAFMQLGSRIGVDIYYKYFEAFGLFNKTGISLLGESNSIFHDKEKVGSVELATISFGQRFSITPLQLITAVSAIANKGTLVQPQIVGKIVNNDTGATTSTETKEIRKVISEETAKTVLDMMEYVVTDGSGSKGAVKGYTIAGKTGTSEATVGSDKGNTLSFVAVSPSDNPKLIALVVLYNTSKKNAYGSTLAAPVVSNILSEVLPYYGISADDTNSGSINNYTTVPDVTNKTITEAEKILKNSGLNVMVSCDEDHNSTLVKTQTPSAKTLLLKNSTVMIYSDNNSTRTSVTVPDLTGMSLTQAKQKLQSLNLNISFTGTGLIKSQSIKSGESVEEGTVINVTMSY